MSSEFQMLFRSAPGRYRREFFLLSFTFVYCNWGIYVHEIHSFQFYYRCDLRNQIEQYTDLFDSRWKWEQQTTICVSFYIKESDTNYSVTHQLVCHDIFASHSSFCFYFLDRESSVSLNLKSISISTAHLVYINIEKIAAIISHLGSRRGCRGCCWIHSLLSHNIVA